MPPTLAIEPNDRVTFKVRHEDADFLVIDKPAGLVTQPGLGHEHDTLLNGLFAQYGALLQNLGKDRDYGLLHRLDRETSGLLLVGLRPRAYDALREAFAGRTIRKYYWAVTDRAPREASGVIKKPLAEVQAKGRGSRSGKDRFTPSVKLARISSSGKPAVTAYRVLSSSDVASLIECRPLTGRLHQVRVHMDSIGCPILGDEFYGPSAVRDAAPRLALHAHRLVFEHPAKPAETIDVQSPWPRDLRSLLTRLKLPRPDMDTPSGGEPPAREE